VSDEINKETTKKKPQFILAPVVRPSKPKPTARDIAAAEAQEQERSDQQVRDQQRAWRAAAAGVLNGSASRIRSGTGSAVKVEDGFGSGASGPSYASYAAEVWRVYESAWVRPEDAVIEYATAEISVTIASDGRVIESSITKRSGDRAVDASLQSALDRVHTIGRPFPEGAKDKQRTYRIPFHMKTNRGTA
jgi:TonB family protein